MSTQTPPCRQTADHAYILNPALRCDLNGAAAAAISAPSGRYSYSALVMPLFNPIQLPPANATMHDTLLSALTWWIMSWAGLSLGLAVSSTTASIAALSAN